MGRKLTNRTDAPFELCFKYPLQKGYTLKELTRNNCKELQRFLDNVSQMTVDQVDKQYGRVPDRTDSFNGMQVYHYGVTDKFRIHVINEAGYYKIIRLDPNHEFHK